LVAWFTFFSFAIAAPAKKLYATPMVKPPRDELEMKDLA